MKAVFLVALVAVVLSLAQSSTACTAINRRNTVWVGLPGPGTSATYVLETLYERAPTRNLSKAEFLSLAVPLQLSDELLFSETRYSFESTEPTSSITTLMASMRPSI